MKNAFLIPLGLLIAGWLPLTLAANPLTLEQAMMRAFKDNLGLQIEAIEPEIARDTLGAEWGGFDPNFFFEANYLDSSKPQNTLDFLSTGQVVTDRVFEEENNLLNTGIGVTTPYGTEVEFLTRVSELDNSVNRESPVAIFNPEYEAFMGVNITQPLLKNFGYHNNMSGVNLARLGISIAEYDQQIAVTNVAIEVVNTYCDLAFGEQNLKNKQNSVELAQRFVEETEKRIEAGFLKPIDLDEARVQLSESQEEVMLAEDYVRERRTMLGQLLGIEDFNTASAITTILPRLLWDKASPVESMVDTAKSSRPDYQRATAAAEQAEIRQNYARNQKMPQLNFLFSYGLNGLSNSYGNSYDDLFDGETPTWSAGIVFSVPIGRMQGRAESMTQERRKRQAQLDINRIAQSIDLDVRNAVARLQALEAQVETAKASVRLAESTLEAEAKRLEVGQTTNFRVLQIFDKLTDAQTRQLAGEVELQKATVHLWAVTGVILNNFNFVLEDSSDNKEGYWDWLLNRQNY